MTTRLSWRDLSWSHLVRLIPTIAIAVWMAVITIVAVTSINAINSTTAKRVKAICGAENITRSLSASIIAVGAAGGDAAAPRWQALQHQLGSELTPIDCNALSSLTAGP